MNKLNIIVHPQAMLIISNHYSRLPYDTPDPPIKYHVGFLLGNYENDKVVVLSALEALITEKDGKLKLDNQMHKREMDLNRSIYPNNKAIGWYTLDKYSDEENLSISDALNVVDDFDNLLLGKFFPDEGDQPFHLFIQKGTEFIPTDYTYEAELAERIAMLQLQSEGTAESQIRFTENAFRSLDEDLSIIQNYLEKVLTNEAPFEPTIVRACANISQWFDHDVKPKNEDGDDNNDDNNSDDEDATEEQSLTALYAGTMFEAVIRVLDLIKQQRQ